MKAREQVLSEITRLLAGYESVRDNTLPPQRFPNLGAIDALEGLKRQIKSLDDELSPTVFLNQVAMWCDEFADLAIIAGNPGSGANSEALPGRKEACRRIKQFVRNLKVND